MDPDSPQSTKPEEPIDFLTVLPTEVALYLVKHHLSQSARDVCVLGLVSRLHNQLASDDGVWKMVSAQRSLTYDDNSNLFRLIRAQTVTPVDAVGPSSFSSSSSASTFPDKPERHQLFPWDMISPFTPVNHYPDLLDYVPDADLIKTARALEFLHGIPLDSSNFSDPKPRLLSLSSPHLVVPSDKLPDVPFKSLWKLSYGSHLIERKSRHFITHAELSALEWEFRFRSRSFSMSFFDRLARRRSFGSGEDGADSDDEETRTEADGEPGRYRAFFEKDAVYRSENFFGGPEGEIRMNWRAVGDNEDPRQPDDTWSETSEGDEEADEAEAEAARHPMLAILFSAARIGAQPGVPHRSSSNKRRARQHLWDRFRQVQVQHVSSSALYKDTV
jgi:hypothetical protein